MGEDWVNRDLDRDQCNLGIGMKEGLCRGARPTAHHHPLVAPPPPIACCTTTPCRYIPMPEEDPYSSAFSNINTFASCVQLCNYDPCQFVT